MSEEQPSWLQAFDALVGLIAIILGIIILTSAIFPIALTELVLVWLIGIGLLLFGLVALIRGFMMKGMQRILYIIGGLVLVIIGALAFAIPILVQAMVIMLMGLAIVIYGAILLIGGLMDAEATGGQKILALIIGLLFVIVGILVIIYWATWGTAVLLIFLAIFLLFNGTVRLLMAFGK